ncbi:MAG: ABC transporter substrate-binding protein, partial [Geminicoccaceae bacterium]
FSDKGADDEVELALRALFRETDFRLALSHAFDREAIGQAIARGPFAYPYTGGFVTGAPQYDKASTDFQPFDQAKANALLDGLGLEDSDGNGTRNLPDGGADIEIIVNYPADRNEQRKQLDAMTSLLAEVGIRLLPRGLDGSTMDTFRAGGSFTAVFQRRPLINPTRESCETLPVGEDCPFFHQSHEGKREWFDFEKQIADAYSRFVSSDDPKIKTEATSEMQQLITRNAYVIGTVQAPAALLINKRIRNAHPSTPVFMYEWAEDAVIRERLWTEIDQQVEELLPNTIATY